MRTYVCLPGAWMGAWSWQFVLEPLAGYLRLAELLYQQGPQRMIGWNFGPREEDAQPVQWLVQRICAQWGAGARWSTDAGHHPHEAGYLKLDSSMAHAHLGWHSRLPLEAALDWTVEWYRAFAAGSDMRALTEEQIRRFMAA